MNTVIERPKLTVREEELLNALNLMRGWALHYLEPSMSGRGIPYDALKRDMNIASKAIEEATGGCES